MRAFLNRIESGIWTAYKCLYVVYIQSGETERTSWKMKCNRFVKYMCFFCSLLRWEGMSLLYDMLKRTVCTLIRVGSVTTNRHCHVLSVLYSILCSNKLYDCTQLLLFFSFLYTHIQYEFKTTGTILFHGRFMHIRLFWNIVYRRSGFRNKMSIWTDREKKAHRNEKAQIWMLMLFYYFAESTLGGACTSTLRVKDPENSISLNAI